MSSDQSLLFLAGLGRSGTTALLEVFAAHADIALGVERYKRLYPRDEEPVTADLFEEGRFFDFTDGLTNLTPEQAPEWAPHYAAMRAKWSQARYVGDKMVAIRLQHVWETLPDARFVCIVRDLEPVAASWEARAQNPDDLGWSADQDATKAVAGWNRSLRRVRRAVKQRPDHAVVVEYDRFFGDASAPASTRCSPGWGSSGHRRSTPRSRRCTRRTSRRWRPSSAASPPRRSRSSPSTPSATSGSRSRPSSRSR